MKFALLSFTWLVWVLEYEVLSVSVWPSFLTLYLMAYRNNSVWAANKTVSVSTLWYFYNVFFSTEQFSLFITCIQPWYKVMLLMIQWNSRISLLLRFLPTSLFRHESQACLWVSDIMSPWNGRWHHWISSSVVSLFPLHLITSSSVA